MPLNDKIIGKKYMPSSPFEVTDHEGIYYALAYNEDNDAYFDKRRHGGTIIPPMYAVRYMGESAVQVLRDNETGLNFDMTVHHAQEFEWLKPVRAGNRIISEAEITGIEPSRLGGILKCGIVSKNQEGDIVARSVWSFLDRSAASPKAGIERPMRVKSEPLYAQDIHARNGQTWIYAEASGDDNPIHVDDRAARELGLDGIILHGLCTMAFAHKVCVDNLTGEGRDPMKIRKLSVQFARPVIPGEVIGFRLHKMDEDEVGISYAITAVNQRKKNVLLDAWCLALNSFNES